jgi:hypothetical protein
MVIGPVDPRSASSIVLIEELGRHMNQLCGTAIPDGRRESCGKSRPASPSR